MRSLSKNVKNNLQENVLQGSKKMILRKGYIACLTQNKEQDEINRRSLTNNVTKDLQENVLQGLKKMINYIKKK